MPVEVQKLWMQSEIQRTPAEWALRWVWNHPGVSLLLSGMNEEEQIEENLRIADSAGAGSLTEAELECIDKVKRQLAAMLKVGCTGCGYCMPCPAGVNIPMCFAYYNDRYLFNDRRIRGTYMSMTAGADGGNPLTHPCAKIAASVKNTVPSICRYAGT
jgi:predicted aldo/keto reductase-like oxidoreductase